MGQTIALISLQIRLKCFGDWFGLCRARAHHRQPAEYVQTTNQRGVALPN